MSITRKGQCFRSVVEVDKERKVVESSAQLPEFASSHDYFSEILTWPPCALRLCVWSSRCRCGCSRRFENVLGHVRFGIDDRGRCNHGVLRRLETFHDVNAARPRRVKDKSFSTPEKPNRDLCASILGRGQCSLESRWPSES